MDNRKRREFEQYQDMVARVMPERHKQREDGIRVLSRTVTFQVTEDCNLACFVAGTKILMADETYKNIEDIEVGDMVMGFQENLKETIRFYLTAVTHTFVRHGYVRKICTNMGNVVRCTDEHPFLNDKFKWVRAEDLTVGDKICSIAGIETIMCVELLDEYVTVYNFETETHTYIANNLCVHNCTYCFSGDTQIRMADYSTKPISEIQIGDKVIAFDEYPDKNKPLFYYITTVTQTFERQSKVRRMYIEYGNIVDCTDEHPFLNEKYEWVQAKDLNVGDKIYSIGGAVEILDIELLDDEITVYNFETESHTYIANNMCVHNCYQGHKTKKHMSFETAKKAVDMLLSSTEENNPYINPAVSPGIIIEFIGGEPFLEVDLMDQIVDYFKKEARRLCHPWAEWFCISICSNGVNYFDENVQRFLRKNQQNVSFSITIDGNKQLHDSCRLFPDGRPSYDLAVSAALDWMNRGHYMGSKITIAPGNVQFLFDALTHMIDLGYVEINANCVYEDVWSAPYATVMYHELKRVCDYLFENDLENDIYISLFEDYVCQPMTDKDNENFCGGVCDMLCIDPDGNYSICIRYLPTSLGDDQPPLYIGNVDRGLLVTEEEKECMKCMRCITRRSQSTDECYYCPIANGCGWCFKAGTMITTPDGQVPIEDIKVGDVVITGSGNTKPVENVSKRYATDTVCIKANGCEPVYTTFEHPFWTLRQVSGMYLEEPEWVKACDLRKDDMLLVIGDVANYWTPITSVAHDVDGYEVYNMSVADDHTYIANGVVVHNCSALNYQLTGSVNIRTTGICIMHKARALANIYFWNKYYRKLGMKERFAVHIPDEWALEIISQDELDMLKDLAKED